MPGADLNVLKGFKGQAR